MRARAYTRVDTYTHAHPICAHLLSLAPMFTHSLTPLSTHLLSHTTHTYIHTLAVSRARTQFEHLHVQHMDVYICVCVCVTYMY